MSQSKIALVVVLMVSWHFDVLATQKPRVEGCLGGFCFYGPLLIPEPELVAFYGEGEKKKYEDDVVHTYYDPTQKLWVRFSSHFHGSHRLEDILVTKNKLCDEKFTPARPFPNFETPLGISLDSTPNDIEMAYGEPLHKGTVKKVIRLSEEIGTPYYHYYTDKKDQLLGTEFYFLDGHVHTLVVTASE